MLSLKDREMLERIERKVDDLNSLMLRNLTQYVDSNKIVMDPSLEKVVITRGDTAICNCGEHQRGELTGGWCCPIHGQQF